MLRTWAQSLAGELGFHVLQSHWAHGPQLECLCATRKGPTWRNGDSWVLQSRSDAAKKKQISKNLFFIISLALGVFLGDLRRPSRASRQRGWGIGRTVGMCPAITSMAKLSSFPSSLIFRCNLSVRQRLVQLLEKQPRVCVREAAKRWMFREKSPKALGMKGYFREGDPSLRTILHRESFWFPLPKA